MLKKMLLQGLAAAVLIGGAAVVYAQVRDNGYLSAPQTKTSHSPGAKEGAKERDGPEVGARSGSRTRRATRRPRRLEDEPWPAPRTPDCI